MHQTSYVSRLRDLPGAASYSDYRSLRAKLAWSSNTRKDICCSAAKLAQVPEEGLKSETFSCIKEINKIV